VITAPGGRYHRRSQQYCAGHGQAVPGRPPSGLADAYVEEHRPGLCQGPGEEQRSNGPLPRLAQIRAGHQVQDGEHQYQQDAGMSMPSPEVPDLKLSEAVGGQQPEQ
jgi:hypothetical protein